MVDGKNIDFSKTMNQVSELKYSIIDIESDLKPSISQDLLLWYQSKSKEMINILEEIEYQLSDKNDNRY